MKARMSRQRRHTLVEARIVLHRARPERVGPGVEIEVAARDPVVVADDLRLRDLRKLGWALAEQVGGDELVERALRNIARGHGSGAAARDRALEDRGGVLPLLRGRGTSV